MMQNDVKLPSYTRDIQDLCDTWGVLPNTDVHVVHSKHVKPCQTHHSHPFRGLAVVSVGASATSGISQVRVFEDLTCEACEAQGGAHGAECCADDWDVCTQLLNY